MSSAAATRTSTGNVTACPCRCTTRRSPAKAFGSASRGTAYSISRNRTRRELARGEAVEARYQAGRRGAEPGDEGERAVADQLVAHPLGHPPPHGPVGLGGVV